MKQLTENKPVLIGLIAIFIISALVTLLIFGSDESGDDGSGNQTSTQPTDDTKPSSFAECVAAGNPVMESFPEQCRSEDGETFVNEEQQAQLNGDPDENTSGELDESPTTQYDLTLFGITAPDAFSETGRTSVPDGCGEGKTVEGLSLQAADGRFIDISVNPCGRGVSSDVFLPFSYALSISSLTARLT